ncbi:hypothetical protein LBMAG42_13910 [Deltaproteobacteria bacterium]|nr:hypothetical protein LBMAG42_13910 [Deltaproteobacteria bacterium]
MPSRIRTVIAPGKLVLLGEYAVLDGAPAIVAAVDRGVRCDVEAGEGLLTPGDDRFVRAALESAPRAFYRFSDVNPAHGLSGKPGFGGSAAATVAAVLAAGLPAASAFEVHERVQGGGSGIDVFASIYGGVRRFPDGEPVACPPISAVWSGQSAATGPRVQRYRLWGGREAFVAESRALVAAFAQEPLRAAREAYALLCAMAHEAGIDYDLPAFRSIASLAARFGGAAKPSGAGGGDIAVALFPDTAARIAFEAACAAEKLTTIPVNVAHGAR